MTIGKIKLAWGFDGVTAWTMDQNGKVVQGDDKALETKKTNGYFDNLRWLSADQGGGRVSISESEKDPTGAWAVLEVAAPSGHSRILWFNTRIGLLDRTANKNDVATTFSELSDYRSVGGLLFAFRANQRVFGKSERGMSIATSSIAVNEPIDDTRFKMTCPPMLVHRISDEMVQPEFERAVSSGRL
jgi:hypothetical protein